MSPAPIEPYEPPQAGPVRANSSRSTRYSLWRLLLVVFAFATLAAAALLGLLLVAAGSFGDVVWFSFHPYGFAEPIGTPAFDTKTVFRVGVGLLAVSFLAAFALAGWLWLRSGYARQEAGDR